MWPPPVSGQTACEIVCISFESVSIRLYLVTVAAARL